MIEMRKKLHLKIEVQFENKLRPTNEINFYNQSVATDEIFSVGKSLKAIAEVINWNLRIKGLLTLAERFFKAQQAYIVTQQK